MSHASQDAPSVVIVGAGPVGLSLALGLARLHVHSLVVEQKPALSRHSKAPGIHARTLEIFRAWGVADRFIASGTFLQRVSIWMAGQAAPVATIDLARFAPASACPGILVLPQNDTERLLAEAATASGYVDLRFGVTMTGFAQDGTGVSVRLGAADGSVSTVRTAYLVGCDGAHSTVRHLLGWHLAGKTYATEASLADIVLPDRRNDLPWPRLYTGAGRLIAGLRLEPDLWRIIQLTGPGGAARDSLSEAGLQYAVEALYGPGHFELVWASSFQLHCRNSPHFRDRRVLLAGDAAHLNSPVGGQGMNSGIHDAQNLAWKLARALAGGDEEALLQSYEQERRPVVVHNVERTTDLLTRLVTLPWLRLRRLVGDVARWSLQRPWILQRLLPRIMMLDARYDQSALIQDDAPLLGVRAPDGVVIGPDGGRGWLSDRVFPQALLVLFDDGRWPRWEPSAIRALLASVSGVDVVRLVAPGVDPSGADLRGIDGRLWRSWRARGGTVVLIRPDGHVGWRAERPSAAALSAGVSRALGQPERQPMSRPAQAA